MAWIELHQTLWTHRKTLILAALLETKNLYAASHMIHLWTWSLDNAPDGDLSGLPPMVIAIGAGWDGEPQTFIDAAVSAGFLESNIDGELYIHDWMDYAGKLLERRAADRERKRSSRGRPSDIPSPSVVTVPNRTVPNRTKDTPPLPPTGGDAGETPQDESHSGESLTVEMAGGAEKSASHSTTLSDRFNEFWSAYPRKVGKKAARRAWDKLKPDDSLLEIMIQAIERAKQTLQWQRDAGQYIPNPATWLNQGRWEDELAPANQRAAPGKGRQSYNPAPDPDLQDLLNDPRIYRALPPMTGGGG